MDERAYRRSAPPSLGDAGIAVVLRRADAGRTAQGGGIRYLLHLLRYVELGRRVLGGHPSCHIVACSRRDGAELRADGYARERTSGLHESQRKQRGGDHPQEDLGASRRKMKR